MLLGWGQDRPGLDGILFHRPVGGKDKLAEKLFERAGVPVAA